MKKPDLKIQKFQKFPDQAWAEAQGFPNAKLPPKRRSKPRRLPWEALLVQKLERLRIPQLTQGPELKPGTHWARAVTILTSDVQVKDLKTFERQLGEALAKRAIAMDQEFFSDFTKALNYSAEERSDWRVPVSRFLLRHSRKLNSFKTEDQALDWIFQQPEIAKMAVSKDRIKGLLKEVNFRETRGKS